MKKRFQLPIKVNGNQEVAVVNWDRTSLTATVNLETSIGLIELPFDRLKAKVGYDEIWGLAGYETATKKRK